MDDYSGRIPMNELLQGTPCGDDLKGKFTEFVSIFFINRNCLTFLLFFIFMGYQYCISSLVLVNISITKVNEKYLGFRQGCQSSYLGLWYTVLKAGKNK